MITLSSAEQAIKLKDQSVNVYHLNQRDKSPLSFSGGESWDNEQMYSTLQTTPQYRHSLAPCKRIRTLESGKCLLVESVIREIWVLESRILGIGIQNTAQGIRSPTNYWNLESKFPYQRIQNTVPGIQNPRRGIHNPRLSWISLHGAISLLIAVLLHTQTILSALSSWSP